MKGGCISCIILLIFNVEINSMYLNAGIYMDVHRSLHYKPIGKTILGKFSFHIVFTFYFWKLYLWLINFNSCNSCLFWTLETAAAALGQCLSQGWPIQPFCANGLDWPFLVSPALKRTPFLELFWVEIVVLHAKRYQINQNLYMYIVFVYFLSKQDLCRICIPPINGQ